MGRTRNNAAPDAAPPADTDSLDSVDSLDTAADDSAADTAAETTGDPVADAELAALNDQYAPQTQIEETTELVPVVAVHKINGTRADGGVLPGTIFTPDSIEQLAELRALSAVRNLNEAEAAVFAAQSDGE